MREAQGAENFGELFLDQLTPFHSAKTSQYIFRNFILLSMMFNDCKHMTETKKREQSKGIYTYPRVKVALRPFILFVFFFSPEDFN
jgi:hypothetical protein